MEFYAIKPSFTYFGYEVYKISIEKEKIEGIYLGKLFSRKEKISILLESMLYALLGGYFFGTPGYACAALASPDIEPKIGKPERNEKKNFSYRLNEVKIKVSKKLLKIKGKKRHKFIVDKDVLEKLGYLM